MVNEIKLDNNICAFPSRKLSPLDNSKPSPFLKHDEDITVTQHLSHLLNLFVADNHVPDEANKVLAMKHKIAANEYHIDFDTLSSQLINSGVLTEKE